ncbi:hypothetical protein N9C64_02975, partial [Paracoccaceae bacterium]|nr:hypothetical protein [Paracoccaceae bacterium]
ARSQKENSGKEETGHLNIISFGANQASVAPRKNKRVPAPQDFRVLRCLRIDSKASLSQIRAN